MLVAEKVDALTEICLLFKQVGTGLPTSGVQIPSQQTLIAEAVDEP